ncbi:DMT family transporter [Plantactinospora sp. WMMB334]|uniref:DMT family transporter n=1 Tax=Plantactinospora sp. WMMB334 TaxID=3404119 RepID=UPI003B93A99C
MLIAIAASLAAGACFALAGVLQQHEASARPSEEGMRLRLLLALARRRLWLVGLGFAVLSYGFQMLALAHGPLILVQPLITTELVFAIPLAARLRGCRIGVREWSGGIAVAVGLAVALAAARPRGGAPMATTGGWLLTIGIVAALAAGALAGGRTVSGSPRASLIALAAGLTMGTQSALLDITVHRIGEGAGALFGAWQTYLLVVASIGGLLLIQSAYQAGPLAASAPVIDAVEPAVAVVIGVALFGESVRAGWLAGTAAGAGVLLLLAGIVLLDTSPRLAALHEREKAARPGSADRSGTVPR